MKVYRRDCPYMYYLVHDFAGLFPEGVVIDGVMFSGKVEVEANRCSCTMCTDDHIFVMTCCITESDYLYCNSECDILAWTFISNLYEYLIDESSWDEFHKDKSYAYFWHRGCVYKVSKRYACILNMKTNNKYEGSLLFWDGDKYDLDVICKVPGRVMDVPPEDYCESYSKVIETPIAVVASEFPCMQVLLFKLPNFLGNNYCVGKYVYNSVADLIDDKYFCTLQNGNDVTYMRGYYRFDQCEINCSAICEDTAAGFINRMLETVSEEISRDDLYKDNSRYAYLQFGEKYYRMAERYSFLLEVKSDKILYQYPDVSDDTMFCKLFGLDI